MKYSNLTIYSSVFIISLAGIARGNFANAGDPTIAGHHGGGGGHHDGGGGGHHDGGGGGHHDGGGGHHDGGGGHHDGGGGGHHDGGGGGHHDGGGGGHHGGGGGHHGGGGYPHYPPGGYYPPIGGYYPPAPLYPNPIYGCQVIDQSGEVTQTCAGTPESPIQCYADVTVSYSNQERLWGQHCVADVSECLSNGAGRVEPCYADE